MRQRKQSLINKKKHENKKRIPYTYKLGEEVMVHKGTEYKNEQPYAGPFPITKVNTNGTVRIQMGAVNDTVNIRRIQPFRDTPISNHGGECNRPSPTRAVGTRKSARLQTKKPS